MKTSPDTTAKVRPARKQKHIQTDVLNNYLIRISLPNSCADPEFFFLNGVSQAGR